MKIKMTNTHKKWMTHIVAGITLTLVVQIWNGINLLYWFAGLVSFLIGSIGTYLLIDHLERIFTKRIAADEDIPWTAFLNDVEIGTITDYQYAIFQLTALRDWHNMLKQLLNIGRIILNFADKMFIALPLFFFWGAVITFLFMPEQFGEMLVSLQTASSAELISTAQMLLKLCIMAFIGSTTIMACMGFKFGFTNHYSEAVNRMLRQHFNTPTEGNFVLYRFNHSVTETTKNTTV